jgi:sugar-specific transcriptional regulator TrmB
LGEVSPVEIFYNKFKIDKMKLADVLIDLGLTKKEAKVYLAALELGAVPASEIATRARINRVSAYDILDKLSLKGFIATSTKNRVKIFDATDPDLIMADYKQKYRNLKEALPDLRRLNGKTSHPKVRYFEGIEGIKKVYADTLTARTEILNYADSKTIRNYWPEYDVEYVAQRVKKKIYLRGISPHDEYGEEVVAANKSSHREIRLVPPTEFSFANEINVYDDKVSIISFGQDEIVGMIIESHEVADTQRAIFMMAWTFAGSQKKGRRLRF